MNRVLFVTNKWATGTPGGPLTIMQSVLFNSFSQVFPNYYDVCYFDESYYIYNKHVNEILLDYCQKNNIDTVIICFLSRSTLNPSIEVCEKIKCFNNIKICVMWPDTHQWDLIQKQQYKHTVDLNVLLDNRTPCVSLENNDLNRWTPIDETLFYFQKHKTTNISFIGSVRQPSRIEILNEVSKKHEIVITGGQMATNEINLTTHKYAELIRNSKISLNFSNAVGFHQTKGRVFETLACNSLLIENKNNSTPLLLTPGIDYVEFNDTTDLTKKIEYYLQNENERLQIANQGYLKYKQNYSPTIFWHTVMEKLYETT